MSCYNSWFDLLQLDPALDLQQRSPGGFQGDLSIRGATFGQTLVLLNGLRINDVQTGHFNLDLPVPLEMLSGIEVLKGSGSALYGSDAIGGVVNVRTEPIEPGEFRLLAGVGNFGVNEQHAVTSFGQSVVAGRDRVRARLFVGLHAGSRLSQSGAELAEHAQVAARSDQSPVCLQRPALRRE